MLSGVEAERHPIVPSVSIKDFKDYSRGNSGSRTCEAMNGKLATHLGSEVRIETEHTWTVTEGGKKN